MLLFQILLYAFPVIIGVAALEAVVLMLVLRRKYNWKASLASLANFLTRHYFVEAYLRFSIATPVLYWAVVHNIHAVPLSPFLAIPILFLGQEFAYYWFHQCSHRIRWFWATHSVHHSPNELNFSAAYRISLTGHLIGGEIFYAPLLWLGFSPAAVFTTLGLNLLYQFWIHSEWIPKLGPLEYVLNTPSHHRVHHSANVDYLDANYGGVLIVFDRLFGTCVVERDDEPCRIGLVKPLTTNNPVLIDFHEWMALARDLRHARSAQEWLFYLFGPPGWRPNGEGLTTEALRRAHATAAVPAE
jgi:sterol desaturase/sphingolipid hydroxylase (fatty acid hydroxylase superfamily)